jgi:hypothetical protein
VPWGHAAPQGPRRAGQEAQRCGSGRRPGRRPADPRGPRHRQPRPLLSERDNFRARGRNRAWPGPAGSPKSLDRMRPGSSASPRRSPPPAAGQPELGEARNRWCRAGLGLWGRGVSLSESLQARERLGRGARRACGLYGRVGMRGGGCMREGLARGVVSRGSFRVSPGERAARARCKARVWPLRARGNAGRRMHARGAGAGSGLAGRGGGWWARDWRGLRWRSARAHCAGRTRPLAPAEHPRAF